MGAHYDVAVIGGGSLGAASAIATARRLATRNGSKPRVCVIERNVIGSGLTARHSGILRAANADLAAAKLAHASMQMWRDLNETWGVQAFAKIVSALWIARDSGNGDNEKWNKLAQQMATVGVAFEKISASAARDLCPAIVKLNDGEVYYFEPGAMQLDPAAARTAFYAALRLNDVDVHEKTRVTRIVRAGDGRVAAIETDSQQQITADFYINAAGPWSVAILGAAGLSIPVSIEPVNVVNWLTSNDELKSGMPIIADYVNLAYFRAWGDGEIHMHQPRRRAVRDIARAFAENPLALTNADSVLDPSNQSLSYQTIKRYEDIASRRFRDSKSAVYGSGFRSFFDITPDLRFILGPDHRAPNLIHCLGAGQSFKYAPVFGELMADFVVGSGSYLPLAQSFAIDRFDDTYMKAFWKQVDGVENSLATESQSDGL